MTETGESKVAFFLAQMPQDPADALDLLLRDALPRVPEIVPDALREQFEGLQQGWRSQVLLDGEAAVRTKGLAYLTRLTQSPRFGRFEISGNPFQACAQVNAVYLDAQGATQSVSPFRVWQSQGRILGCGNSLLEP